MADKSKLWVIGDSCSYGVYYTVAAISEEEARKVFRTEIWEPDGCSSRCDFCNSADAFIKCDNGDCPSCPYLKISNEGRSMSHENC